jgi:uncharacterized secreted protein with C-terminal beta-propeller domain
MFKASLNNLIRIDKQKHGLVKKMIPRKKMILASILIGTALLVNIAVSGMENGNIFSDQRVYDNDSSNSIYEDYLVVKNEDGGFLLLPKSQIDNVKEGNFKDLTTKSDDTPFIEEDDSDNVKKFDSLEELKDYLQNHTKEQSYEYYGGAFKNMVFEESLLIDDTDSDVLSSGSPSSDHSGTNVQELGVDEGDIVKNDGEYAYIVSRNRCAVIIVDVNPPENAEILATINTRGYIQEIYVRGGKLVVLGQRTVYQIDPSPVSEDDRYYSFDKDEDTINLEVGKFYYLNYIYYQATFIDIFDIEDREEPNLLDSHLIRGYPLQSRMIGDFLYVITSYSLYRNFQEYDLPVPASEIYHLNCSSNLNSYGYYLQLTTILSIDITEPSEIADRKVILMASSSNIYVSLNNIYITYYRYYYLNRYSITTIHRISINDGKILYKVCGEIEGRLINRFAMSEHKDHFRVAASIGSPSSHTVYVLDMDLNIVGQLEGLAPNERMFSARFMGDRLYFVTFMRVDPFFVIDLSDPENPELLGELVIPGWSDYLHPYDENHIIGLGKEATENGRTLGVKLSLFDVTDVENPKEISKYVIGDSYSSTIASYDPHAFLFDREKNLLVIPVQLNYTTSCAYVFDLSLEGGFVLKGTVSHPDSEYNKTGYYRYYYYWNQIIRSFYISNTLYTLSYEYLQMNDLNDLSEINIIELPNEPYVSSGPQVMCIYIEPFM